MPWDGVERRRVRQPATRRFVFCVALVVVAYVTFVFWRVEVNGDRDLDRVDQAAQAQYLNDLRSCQRGDDIRRALIRLGQDAKLGTCRERVERP